MKLLDSNILIYAALPENEFLVAWVEDADAGFSELSFAEVLGYPGLTPEAEAFFEQVFARSTLWPVDAATLRHAARLRRTHRMKLGDAIIGATALERGCELVTRNVGDFTKITGLRVLNSFGSQYEK